MRLSRDEIGFLVGSAALLGPFALLQEAGAAGWAWGWLCLVLAAGLSPFLNPSERTLPQHVVDAWLGIVVSIWPGRR